MFDPTITLGAILNAGVIFVGFVVAFTRIGGRLDLLSLRLGAVEEQIKASRDVDSRLSTIEERITNHTSMLTTTQRDISDLRRGNGFIRGGQGHLGTDKEY